ncbi:MAG: type IIA DNA topoisomerase subunit B [Bacteroidales bacterium]|nr:type IIA DNA topoisomerase subunit B [Bacteroidales bacterium]MBR5056476.1 type IIA DNA topoisomerase subunit B [Bacteroidales bacterium]
MQQTEYGDESMTHLEDIEHIRLRPGMYIGRLGDGTAPNDGMYVLMKEIIDNSIDEFAMGFGKVINIKIEDKTISIRDFGRGIPFGFNPKTGLNNLDAAVSKLHTGAKYDSEVFQKSVGMNGVGLKAANALSSEFTVQSFRNGETLRLEYRKGKIVDPDYTVQPTTEKNGTLITFIPDDTLFEPYEYNYEYIEAMLRNYAYLNVGLKLNFNGQEFKSANGLLDLINEGLEEEPLYEPIHLKTDDIEVAFTHGSGYGENIDSFVNGQNTTLGGTHLAAFKEVVAKVIKDFYKKDFNPVDVRQSIIGAVSVRIQEPEFEGQTKVQLGSKYMWQNKQDGTHGPTILKEMSDFLMADLDNYLHKHLDVADIILKKIQDSERERNAISSISKKTKARLKKASIHNKKLRDCRIHYGDKNPLAEQTTIFITEGDSASGSITKSRDANTQAVFSLMGKPFNCAKASKKDLYVDKNVELCLLQSALNIEDGVEGLRYNNIVIATDADVDGMHIRLLMLTFFLKFYPDVVRAGHLYILQTPLFRVRDKKTNMYCYSSAEKEKALKKLGRGAEITRFKGLGEISPDEFKGFIGEDMRLEVVRLTNEDKISDLIEFYMGNNTPVRQKFIRTNLRSDINNVEEEQ